MTWIFMMKQKFEAFKFFKHSTILMKNQAGKIVKCLRTNNDLKLFSIKFNEFYRDEGIATQCIVCYPPQQNKVAERMNMTSLERARCKLSNLGLNRSSWVEVVNTTCYLESRSLSTTIDFKTPVEVLSNKLVE